MIPGFSRISARGQAREGDKKMISSGTDRVGENGEPKPCASKARGDVSPPPPQRKWPKLTDKDSTLYNDK